jgi:hypothetical protein
MTGFWALRRKLGFFRWIDWSSDLDGNRDFQFGEIIVLG